MFHGEKQYSNDDEDNSKLCEVHEFEDDEENKNQRKKTTTPSLTDRALATKLEHPPFTSLDVKAQYNEKIASQQVHIY